MNTSKEADSIKPRPFLSRPKTFRFDELICDELDNNLFFLGDMARNINVKRETLDVIAEELSPNDASSDAYSTRRQNSRLSIIDEQEECELGSKVVKNDTEKLKKLKWPPNGPTDYTKRRKKKGLKEGKITQPSSDDNRTRQRAAGSPESVNKDICSHNSDNSGGQAAADLNVTPASSMNNSSELMAGLQTISRTSICLRAPCLSESTYQRPLPFDRTPQTSYEGVTKSESHLTQMCPQHVSGLREQGATTNSRLQGGKHSDCVNNKEVKNPNEAFNVAQDILGRILLMMWQMAPQSEHPIDSGDLGSHRCPTREQFVRQLVDDIGARIAELRNAVEGNDAATPVNECEKTSSDDSSNTQEHTRLVRRIHQSTWSSNGLCSERTEEETIDHRGNGQSNISLHNHAPTSLFQPPSRTSYDFKQYPNFYPQHVNCACSCHNPHFIYPHLLCNCNSICHPHWKYLTPLLNTCCKHSINSNCPEPNLYPEAKICPVSSMPSISGVGLIAPTRGADDAIQTTSQESFCFVTSDVSNTTMPCGIAAPLKTLPSSNKDLVSARSSQTHRKVRRTPSGTLMIHECERSEDQHIVPEEKRKRISFIRDGHLLEQNTDEEEPKRKHLVSPPPYK